MKSLKEVQELVGLSRREIQELESKKLAKKPTTKNKYGYLLYDTPEIERLWQLKFYKELGYKIPDIKKISKGGGLEEEELDRLIRDLKDKKEKLENLIVIAEGMKKYGVNFNLLRNSMIHPNEIPGENVWELMADGLNVWNNIEYEKWIDEQMLPTEEDSEEFRLFIEAILDKVNTGTDAHDKCVQDKVDDLYKLASKWFSESVFMLWEIVIVPMVSDMETRGFFEENWGEGATDFLIEATRYFCDQHKDNLIDKKLGDAIDNIEALASNRHKESCKEVQDEVENIHMFFRSLKILKEGGDIMFLKNFAEIFSDQAYKNLIDNGEDGGVACFFSRAIEIYLDNLKVLA